MSTHETPVPVCPSCGHGMTTDEMLTDRYCKDDLFALAPNERQSEVRCPSCGVTYHVLGGYRPEYTTALDEDDL